MLDQLDHNNIDTGSESAIAYCLIEGINQPHLFNNILMPMESDESWYLGLSTHDIIHKAEEYEAKWKIINSTVRWATVSTPLPQSQNHLNTTPTISTPTSSCHQSQQCGTFHSNQCNESTPPTNTQTITYPPPVEQDTQ